MGSAARQQPVAQQQPPASDYSAQWAEYYRSIGKVKEAEAIEQQMRAKGGSVPPSGGPVWRATPGRAAVLLSWLCPPCRKIIRIRLFVEYLRILIPVLTIELKQASEMN